jgi:hypothetical protein
MSSLIGAALRGYARLRLGGAAAHRALPAPATQAPTFALLREPLELAAAAADRTARRAGATQAELGWIATRLRPAHARRAVRRVWGRIPEAQLAALDAAGGYVLALPLSGAGVAAVVALAGRATREVLVQRTPWSEAYLAGLLAGAPARIRLCSAQEMVRHRRDARRAGAEPAGYVTFPDHCTVAQEARWRVRFLGEWHYFPILEGLLLAGGAGRLRAPEPAGGGLALAEGPGVSAGREVPTAELGAVTEWLAERMERTLRHDPADVLAWRAVLGRSAVTERRTRQARVNNLRSLLRVWQAYGPGLSGEVHHWSLGRLAELEEAAGRADSALNVPSGIEAA